MAAVAAALVLGGAAAAATTRAGPPARAPTAAAAGSAPAGRAIGPGVTEETAAPARLDPIRRPLTPPPLVDPTPADPLRMLVVGDSLGIDLGEQLASELDGPAVSVTMAATGDTGLANQRYFDWPATLGTELVTDRPQVVVVLVGANDAQGVSGQGTADAAPGTAAWDDAYENRIYSMLTEARAAGARTVWVGMPAMADPDLSAWMQHLDTLFEAVVPLVPGSTYLAPPAALSSGGGGPSLRTPDGVHLTAAGGALLARAVVSTVDDTAHLHLPGATAPGTAGTPPA